MAYEQLSALLDGECTAEELDLLLEEMERSPELKARWSRLCLARDTRDGTRYTKEQTCICAGVMAQLDRVPAELARPNVVELRRPRAMLVKQAIGWAVAASVATVALLVGVNGHDASGLAVNVASVSPGVVPATESVSYLGSPQQQDGNLQTVALRSNGEQQWQDAGDDLDSYLMEHTSSVAEQGMGMGGTLRAARFAAHSAAYRPDGQP